MNALFRAFLVLACIAASAGPLLAAEAPPGASERIDAILAATANAKLPGAAVLVLRDGAVVHSKAYGLANLELGVPNTPRTKFRLASVSKSFTALLVLQLVEQGRLRLDDPLEKYVPGVVGGDKMTIHHLLSHTAGMPDFMSFDEAAKLPRDAAPGERLNYSNLGYSALGRVIEKVTGKTYEAHLREAILDPLGHEGQRLRPARRGPARPRDGLPLRPREGRDARGVHRQRDDFAARRPVLDGRGHGALGPRAPGGAHRLAARRSRRRGRRSRSTDGRRGAYGYGFMLVPYRGLREIAPRRRHQRLQHATSRSTRRRSWPSSSCRTWACGRRGRCPRPARSRTRSSTSSRATGSARSGRRPWPSRPEVLDRYVGRYRIDVPPPVAAVMGDAIEIRREGDAARREGQAGRGRDRPRVARRSSTRRRARCGSRFMPRRRRGAGAGDPDA